MDYIPLADRRSHTAPRYIRPALLALAIFTIAASPPIAAQEKPAPILALEKQGVKIIGTFPAPGGLTAWAAYSGRDPVALYVTPDGKHVIVGTMIDDNAKDVTEASLQSAVEPVLSGQFWQELEQSKWLADGAETAGRIVYVFTDPNCPYCNKLWSDARPSVEAGQVQLRHIMVGILTETSFGKAAALLAADDPSQALHNYEAAHAGVNAVAMDAGQATPLDDTELKPLSKIPAGIRQQLEANQELMLTWGMRATPSLVWRDAEGKVQTRTGASPAVVKEVFGTKQVP